MNLAGIDGRLLRGSGPANAIAHIANCRHVSSRYRIENSLARLAGHGACRSDATRRHERHVAGVEIGPKGWNNSTGRGRTPRRRRIRCAIGVDIEGAVFLNYPAIVGYWGFVFPVQDRYAKIARRRED